MRGRTLSIQIVALLTAMCLAGCSIGPLRITARGKATPTTPIVLRWCDQARDVLCVLSFGLQPPDQMDILLLASPGLPSDLKARATWNEGEGMYPCAPGNSEGTLLACTGPLIPLGSSVHIEVAVADGSTVIAGGDLVLKALALPTVAEGADLPPTDTATITPRATRTPRSGTPYPNPTP